MECMAAGLIMIAHNSGGPAADIILKRESLPPTGFLASNENEYAAILCHILRMPSEKRDSIRQAAR